jgi:hypothetical protein
MKFISFIIFFFLVCTLNFGQTGPADGSVASGVVVTTDLFGKETPASPQRFKLFNSFLFEEDILKTDGSDRDNYVIDPMFAKGRIDGIIDSIILFEEFEGISQTNSIPPDPYIAVGPNHIIQTVNTSWRITDKQGNILRTITADSWVRTNSFELYGRSL